MLFARFLIFTLIQCPGTTNNSCGGVPTAFFFIALNLATPGGDPFVNFKRHSCNVKCSCQDHVNLGNLFLSTIQIQKLLTEGFFQGVRVYSLLFLPLLFLLSWMLVWAAISYQLQKPTHRIWTNIIHLSIPWLPGIWQLVGFFWCKV